MHDWKRYIDQVMVMAALCDSMHLSNPSQRSTPRRTRSSPSESTAPPAPQDTIGTGIDHFRTAHRLQKRHKKRL